MTLAVLAHTQVPPSERGISLAQAGGGAVAIRESSAESAGVPDGYGCGNGNGAKSPPKVRGGRWEDFFSFLYHSKWYRLLSTDAEGHPFICCVCSSPRES